MTQICSVPILVMACKPSMVSRAEQPEKLMHISLSCAIPSAGKGGDLPQSRKCRGTEGRNGS
eukprot:11935145-Heterocapsa_arctica.AAC.1